MDNDILDLLKIINNKIDEHTQILLLQVND